MEKFQTKLTDNLFHAVLSLKSVEECYKFLKMSVRLKKFRKLPSGWRSHGF